MVSIKIDDKLIKDLMTEKVKYNPYDTDKKITHIVKDLIIKEILDLREKNGKRKEPRKENGENLN